MQRYAGRWGRLEAEDVVHPVTSGGLAGFHRREANDGTREHAIVRHRGRGPREAKERGEYGEAKREYREARKIASTIADALIKDELVAKANAQLDEAEYIDSFTKAKKCFELDQLNEALGWAKGAVKTKATPEAKSLLAKIEVAAARKQSESEK